jgi:5-formyltetrahydrofolate cyclo-ligase
MSDTLSDDPEISKAELRAAALARRDALAADQRAAAADAIAARALPLAVSDRMVVAGYAPFRSELDPFPLLRAVARAGARLALPVIVARDAPLIFRDWSFGQPLLPGPYGILQPGSDSGTVEPDLVLVPLAAFDRAGHRVGYGAGYYDRTLRFLTQRRRVMAVGVAFAVQEVRRVPALPHDIGLDYIVTERETIVP